MSRGVKFPLLQDGDIIDLPALREDQRSLSPRGRVDPGPLMQNITRCITFKRIFQNDCDPTNQQSR